jgi:agmatine deiminase
MTDIRFPAEWESHSAVWSAWPSAADLWQENLAPAREEVALFFTAIGRPDPDAAKTRGELIKVLVNGAEARASAETSLADLIADKRAEIFDADIGDIWLRDTGPLFVENNKQLAATGFHFNGWGGKYLLGHDADMADIVAKFEGISNPRHKFIIEGGALETDGRGTIITTRQCLLNKNRNPSATETDVELVLREILGTQKVIWLDEGLLNDHTDGHVDNIVRFLSPGVVGCMHPTGESDPNAALYKSTYKTLSKATDAAGNRLEIVEIPSPGRLTDAQGEVIPASHMNFYIANHSLIVPTYAQTDAQHLRAEEAVDLLAEAIGRPDIYALNASAVLTGGGSFHCITQQVPQI